MARLNEAHSKLLLEITNRPNRQMTFLPAENTTIAMELVDAGKLRIIRHQPLTVEAIEEGRA